MFECELKWLNHYLLIRYGEIESWYSLHVYPLLGKYTQRGCASERDFPLVILQGSGEPRNPGLEPRE